VRAIRPRGRPGEGIVGFGFFRFVIPSCVVLVLASTTAAPTSAPPATLAKLVEDVRSGSPLLDRARRIGGVKIDVGGASLWLESGQVVPVSLGDREPVEFVFRGQGKLQFDAEDPVEAGQIEFFTGRPFVRESFERAVLVVGSPEARAALTGGESAPLDPEAADAMTALHREFRERPEFRMKDMARGILLSAMRESGYETYLASWMDTEEHEEVLVIHDPEHPEPLSIGHFDQRELEGRRKHEARRDLIRDQRRGRSTGLTLDDYGEWQSWTVTGGLAVNRSLLPVRAPFECEHNRISIEIGDDALNITGRATLTLRAHRSGRRHVRVRLARDLRVTKVADTSGRPLSHARSLSSLLVRLPHEARRDATVDVTIEYEGRQLEHGGYDRTFDPISPAMWYPRVGNAAPATYDVTFTWPKRYQLVASGREVSRSDGDRPSARYVIERPHSSFYFELGDFRTHTETFGERVIEVLYPDAMGIERGRQRLPGGVEQIASNTDASLRFLEQLFGQLEVGRHAIVIAPTRGFSYASSGLIVLDSEVWEGNRANEQSQAYGDDYRLKLVHELAHLWWGNHIGTANARDAWISEAMSQHASAYFARLIEKQSDQVWGLPYSWARSRIHRRVGGDRARHQVGPVSLGARLRSSRCRWCEHTLIHGKGPMILHTLESTLGANAWRMVLLNFTQWSLGKDVTTQMFFHGVERITGRDISDLGELLVHGTGAIRGFSEYEIDERSDGSYEMTVTVEAWPSVRRYWAIVPAGDGRIDLRFEAKPDFARERIDLALPVMAVTDVVGPALDGDISAFQYNSRRDVRKPVGSSSRIEIEDGVGRVRSRLDERPRAALVDPDEGTLASIISLTCFPKRGHVLRALNLYERGESEAAAEAARAALEADEEIHFEVVPASLKPSRRARVWDGLTHLVLASIALDRAQLGAAEEHVDEARSLLSRDAAIWVENYYHRVEARMHLLDGNPKKAYRVLWDTVYNDHEDKDETFEGRVLLILAAWAAGEEETAEKLVTEARSSGLRIDPLLASLEAASASDR
jgi:hypothetical protein